MAVENWVSRFADAARVSWISYASPSLQSRRRRDVQVNLCLLQSPIDVVLPRPCQNQHWVSEDYASEVNQLDKSVNDNTHDINTVFSALITSCSSFRSLFAVSAGIVELCAIFAVAALNMFHKWSLEISRRGRNSLRSWTLMICSPCQGIRRGTRFHSLLL